MVCTLNGELLLKDSLIFVDFLRRELAVCLTYRLQGFYQNSFQSHGGKMIVSLRPPTSSMQEEGALWGFLSA